MSTDNPVINLPYVVCSNLALLYDIIFVQTTASGVSSDAAKLCYDTNASHIATNDNVMLIAYISNASKSDKQLSFNLLFQMTPALCCDTNASDDAEALMPTMMLRT